MEQKFLLTLLSNVTSYPNNTIASFRTTLPRKLQLDGMWEVGLTEIAFTRSWYNIQKDQEIFLYSNKNVIHEKSITVPKGCYTDVETLLSMINGKIENFKDRVNVLPHFSYISHSKKVLLVFGADKNDNKVNVRLGYELQQMLGFDVSDSLGHYRTFGTSFSELKNEQEHSISLLTDTAAFAYQASHPVDMRAGIHSLFVYSDIIEASIVGDVYAQLQEAVSVPNNAAFGDQCVVSFQNPNYHRLLSNEFETIKVDIKDDVGVDIPFEYGRVTIKLPFRQWKNII